MPNPLRLILASQSPRRAELLARLGLTFEIMPADIDESQRDDETPPAFAERLAREKAQAIASRHPTATVIGSDTIVVIDELVLGKPRDHDDAVDMLMRLSGREHEVFTGVAVVAEGASHSAVERVQVRFKQLSRSECEQYVATGEPMDKAGAYGIQGFGSANVASIDGDYFAVMGLPIVRTLDLLAKAGWRYSYGLGMLQAP